MQNTDFTAKEKSGISPRCKSYIFISRTPKLAFRTKKRWELNKESFVGIKRNPCALPGSSGTTVVRTAPERTRTSLGARAVLPARHWCCRSPAAPPSLPAGAALAPGRQLLQQRQHQLRALQQGLPLVGSGTEQQGVNLLVGFHSCFFLIAAAPAKRAESHNS